MGEQDKNRIGMFDIVKGFATRKSAGDDFFGGIVVNIRGFCHSSVAFDYRDAFRQSYADRGFVFCEICGDFYGAVFYDLL